MFESRPYQEEAIEIILDTKPRKPTLIGLPTGSGKTVILAKGISRIEGRVLLVVPSTELRVQSLKKIKAVSPYIDVGMVQSNLHDDVHSNVVIATRQSLTSIKSTRMKRMLSHGNFDMVIFDEVHQAIQQIKTIIKKLNKDCRVVGLTATPWNPEMLEVFKKLDYSKSIVDLIDMGYLCQPLAYMVKTKTNLNNVRTVAGEYVLKDLEKAVNNDERNALVVASYLKYASDRKSMLVFATGIDHVEELVKEFNKNGIYAKGLHSKHDKKVYRPNVIEEFKSGKLPVLINCGVLTTGYDHEELSGVILARPTNSRILYAQCIGRGLRIFLNKPNCLIIDIVDIARKHDIANMNSLFEIDLEDGETLEDARKRKKKKEKEEADKIAEEILAEEERAELVRKKIEADELEALKIDLFNRKLKEDMQKESFDWFRVDNRTWGLSYAMNLHLVLENINNKYDIYDILIEKNNDQINKISMFDTQEETMEFVFNKLGFSTNTYLNKNSPWKKDPASEKQLVWAPYAVTKWDAHKAFAVKNITRLMKTIIK